MKDRGLVGTACHATMAAMEALRHDPCQLPSRSCPRLQVNGGMFLPKAAGAGQFLPFNMQGRERYLERGRIDSAESISNIGNINATRCSASPAPTLPSSASTRRDEDSCRMARYTTRTISFSEVLPRLAQGLIMSFARGEFCGTLKEGRSA